MFTNVSLFLPFLFTDSPRRIGFVIAFYWCSEMQALRESEFTLKSIYQNCEEM